MIDEIYRSDVWDNDSKTLISYNSDGSVKEALYQNWNSSGGNWVDGDKESYTNNPDDTISQVLSSEWMPDKSIWELQTRATFTYGLTSIGKQLAGIDQLKVFPNPFTNEITVDFNTLKEYSIQIYNGNGLLVKRKSSKAAILEEQDT